MSILPTLFFNLGFLIIVNVCDQLTLETFHCLQTVTRPYKLLGTAYMAAFTNANDLISYAFITCLGSFIDFAGNLVRRV